MRFFNPATTALLSCIMPLQVYSAGNTRDLLSEKRVSAVDAPINPIPPQLDQSLWKDVLKRVDLLKHNDARLDKILARLGLSQSLRAFDPTTRNTTLSLAFIGEKKMFFLCDPDSFRLDPHVIDSFLIGSLRTKKLLPSLHNPKQVFVFRIVLVDKGKVVKSKQLNQMPQR